MERQRRRTEQEMEIEKKLKTPVVVAFKATPLSKVMDQLARLADVNLHLDPQGLDEEGISSDTPITIEIRHEVMLKSALNLILEPLHLSYVVKDEVLKITSEQIARPGLHGDLQRGRPGDADSELYRRPQHGAAGAYRDAMANVSGGSRGGHHDHAPGGGGSGGKQSGSGTSTRRAGADGGHRGRREQGGMRLRRPGAGGPGGLGGGTQADFDSLIELITSTVQPTTWDGWADPARSPSLKPTSAWSSARPRRSTKRSSTCWNSCGACKTCR